MPTIYIDVLFVVNFFIDFLLLWTCGKLGGVKRKKWRVTLSALIGALYAVCVFFPTFSPAYLLVGKVAVSMILVAVAYSARTWKEFFKLLGLFYFTSFLFGGGIAGIMYLTKFGSRFDMVLSNGSVYFNLPWKQLVAVSLCVFVLISVGVKTLKTYLMRQGLRGRVEIHLGEKSIRVDVLIDTGNQLVDPVTGAPVVVVALPALEKLLPEEIAQAIEGEDLTTIYESLDEIWQSRIRLVPFSAIGTESGLMVGFRPDFILLEWGEGSRRECKCTVAIYPKAMKAAGGYGGILNPALME